jgi:L-arabinose isomerase
MSSAVGTEELTDLSEMLATELLVIDAGTTVRRFSQELRWNQAYYHLARGL